MAVSDYSTHLVDAPVGHHFAQLHRDPRGLSAAVATFIEAGLRRGTGVIVVATQAHTELFFDRVARSGLNAEEFRRSGQLQIFDAEESLDRIMRGDMPDGNELKRAVAPVIESYNASGRGPCRAYGEMVSLLWGKGHHDAAIRLEEHWNELAKLYPLSTFCGYVLDTFDEKTYSSPLPEIGRTHSNILATEDDEALRKALDAASRDIFGISIPELMSYSDRENGIGRHRLPVAQQTMLWIVKNMPTSKGALLERARTYLRPRLAGTKLH